MQRSHGKPARPRGAEHPRATVLCSLRSPDRKRPCTALRTPLFTVGRGPVPRHATIARETRSDARRAAEGSRVTVIERSRGTGPRATGPRTLCFTVGRGPVPRHATIAGDRPPRYGIQDGYFCRFTAPNVVSIRFAAETGPGNSRVTNVAGFPSNATSSI